MTGSEREECIAACVACWEACERTAHFCRERGRGYDDRGRVATLIQCSAFARTLADLLRTDSDLAPAMLEIFAGFCRRCAALCDEFEDEPFVACARQCLASAESADRERASLASG